jgi:hypothetical protein
LGGGISVIGTRRKTRAVVVDGYTGLFAIVDVVGVLVEGGEVDGDPCGLLIAIQELNVFDNVYIWGDGDEGGLGEP